MLIGWHRAYARCQPISLLESEVIKLFSYSDTSKLVGWYSVSTNQLARVLRFMKSFITSARPSNYRFLKMAHSTYLCRLGDRGHARSYGAGSFVRAEDPGAGSAHWTCFHCWWTGSHRYDCGSHTSVYTGHISPLLGYVWNLDQFINHLPAIGENVLTLNSVGIEN